MFNLIEEIQQFKNSELTVEIIRLKLTVKIVPTGMISETDDLIIENFQLDSADYLSGSKKTPFQEQTPWPLLQNCRGPQSVETTGSNWSRI